jgi:hypothetical protein
MKNKVNIYRATIFAPDYSATVLGGKMGTNSDEHSMDMKFLWCLETQTHYVQDYSCLKHTGL